MDEFLHGIKSVPGVRGVMVFDKISSQIHDLFPARYERRDLEILATALGKLYNAGLKEGLFISYFSSGIALSFFAKDFSALALTTAEVNIGLLKERMKKLLPILIGRISARSVSSSETQFQLSVSDSPDLLVKALNQLGSKVRENLGSYIASRELKRSRDKLVHQYPFLSGLYIDNSGKSAIVKSSLTADQEKFVKAFGELISGYYAACAQISPKMSAVSLRSILSDYSMDLSQTGFWR